MTNSRQFDAPGMYQIKVKGTLDGKWSDWFDGFSDGDEDKNGRTSAHSPGDSL